jgi:hypothetical protein
LRIGANGARGGEALGKSDPRARAVRLMIERRVGFSGHMSWVRMAW